MSEIWKDVVGFEGYYQVSNMGRIKSVDRTVNGRRYKSKVKSTKTKNTKNYEKVMLCVNGVDSYFKVHQLVARAFIPNPENKREVNHIDGNKHNNSLENLEWVTSKENKEHNNKLGITRRGSRHQNSILNEEIVFQIKVMISEGIRQCDIARKLHISESRVSDIKRGNTWGHVKIE